MPLLTAFGSLPEFFPPVFTINSQEQRMKLKGSSCVNAGISCAHWRW